MNVTQFVKAWFCIEDQIQTPVKQLFIAQISMNINSRVSCKAESTSVHRLPMLLRFWKFIINYKRLYMNDKNVPASHEIPSFSPETFRLLIVPWVLISCGYSQQWRSQKHFNTGIPVWAPKFERPPKKKYTFISIAGYVFFLNLSKVCFKLSKHFLSIVNHPKV